jgi:hypothetical protein
MRPPFTPIPTHLEPLYLKLRITLAVIIVLVGSGVAYSFLFPTITTSFDFRNPKSSKNQVFDPRSDTNVPRTNGKLETDGILTADTSPFGDFSSLSVEMNLEKQSLSPNQVDISVRKGYRAFRYPLGTAIQDFPTADIYRIDDTYYVLREGTLHPFVSEAALLSRYPAAFAKTVTPEWKGQYTVASDFIGFRVGSLISFADGVYLVVSETDIRPIGSAEIFLALGYRFEDVIPVNEEDLGIYKRGRIFLMGAAHPDGTLFSDQLSGTLYIIEDGTRRPVESGPYRDFLLANTHPIAVDAVNNETFVRCTAVTGFLPRILNCTTPLGSLQSSLGPDYEITLAGQDTPIDISTLTLAFKTRLDQSNMKTLLAKVKQRILTRFGLAIP